MDIPTPTGFSDIHRSVLERLTKVANTDAEVLITGPSGVGKELYANFVHNQSSRIKRQFVPINCGALSNDLLENELFGHVGGAFTGAKNHSEGLVQEAEGGTLFLDEVDSLSMPCQIKLLRFLQNKEYRRLGETRLRKANIRIIAATNADLEMAVMEERFRKDLFFRLRVIPIFIPALKDRPEDIDSLMETFKKRSSDKYHVDEIQFSEEAQKALKGYHWPGNIRELENCIDYLTCLDLIRPVLLGDLPLLQRINCYGKNQTLGTPNQENTVVRIETEGGMLSDIVPFNDEKTKIVAEFEKGYIEKALKQTKGNISAAARLAGKDRRALFELMKKHSIDPYTFRRLHA